MTVGREVGTDVALIETLRFVARWAIEKRGDVVGSQAWLASVLRARLLPVPASAARRCRVEYGLDPQRCRR
jgi:hypothetical protein